MPRRAAARGANYLNRPHYHRRRHPSSTRASSESSADRHARSIKARLVDADEFRSALDRLGLSQVEAASLMARDKQDVHRWCQGTRPVPEYMARMLLLLEALGIKKARRLLLQK